MRIRSIRPEFWRSDDIDALSWDERLVFIGLWSYVDDNGVGLDKLSAIVADLFAGDLERDPRDTFARVADAISAIAARGLITRYTVDGKPYLFVRAWSKHQRVDRPNKERYPVPTSEDAEILEPVATPSRDVREIPPTGEGEKGRRGEVKESDSRGRARASKAHPLPDDWEPSDTHRAKALTMSLDLDHEADQFRNHARANGRTQVDWGASFHTWLGRARPRPSPRPASTGPTPAPSGIARSDQKVRGTIDAAQRLVAMNSDPTRKELTA